MKTDRLVIDTSILISAVLSVNGKPAQIIDLVKSSPRILLFSSETLDELRTRLARSKFDRWVSQEARADFIQRIADHSEAVFITGAVQGCADPNDDMILETAVVGQADAIITGDKKHLLPMHPFKGIPILSAADYLGSIAEN